MVLILSCSQSLKGTRHGCPLSPLLFVLTLEPFLQHVKHNRSIRGIQTGTYHHKVAAYADDLLFYKTEPLISLPSLLRELKQFGSLSNFKVNPKTLFPLLTSNLSWPLCLLTWQNGTLWTYETKCLGYCTFYRHYQSDYPGLSSTLCVQCLSRLYGMANFHVLAGICCLGPNLKVVWVSLIQPYTITVVHMMRVVDWWRHKTQKLWVTLEQKAATAPLAGWLSAHTLLSSSSNPLNHWNPFNHCSSAI